MLNIKSTQNSCVFPMRMTVEKLKREWGASPRTKRCCKYRDSAASAKAGHWGNLRRQRQKSPEIQVRRTAGNDHEHNISCVVILCYEKTVAAIGKSEKEHPVAAIFYELKIQSNES